MVIAMAISETPLPFVQVLSTNGDGTGDTDMTGDYSSAAETFELHGPTAYEDYTIVERILVYVEDAGTFDTGDYGNAVTLTNGIDLAVTTSTGTVQVQLTPVSVKTSGDWAALCYDVSQNGWGTGNEFLTARWTFTKFTDGRGLVLNDGSKLVCTVNDDMRGLVHHRITCQGWKSFGKY